MEQSSADHPEVDPKSIAHAIEVFVHGVAFTRSFTHPYLAETMGPLWVLRDAPRKGTNYRVEEWVAHGVAPAEIDRIARRHTRGRFTICALCGHGESDEPLRAAFKALDYRLHTTEPLMIHPLRCVPPVDAPTAVERVDTQALAARVNKTARARQILPQHLVEDAPLRQYAALLDDDVVGWVRSITVGNATWCSDMYVQREHRRRGIARALMSRMLQEDRAAGAVQSVLLASHTGAKLYPVVGYEQIGTLFIYTPRTR